VCPGAFDPAAFDPAALSAGRRDERARSCTPKCPAIAARAGTRPARVLGLNRDPRRSKSADRCRMWMTETKPRHALLTKAGRTTRIAVELIA
jgi:hypothetical protein